jgi:hypothetical protein
LRIGHIWFLSVGDTACVDKSAIFDYEFLACHRRHLVRCQSVTATPSWRWHSTVAEVLKIDHGPSVVFADQKIQKQMTLLVTRTWRGTPASVPEATVWPYRWTHGSLIPRSTNATTLIASYCALAICWTSSTEKYSRSLLQSSAVTNCRRSDRTRQSGDVLGSNIHQDGPLHRRARRQRRFARLRASCCRRLCRLRNARSRGRRHNPKIFQARAVHS